MQTAPAIIRTRGHRLEGIWHAGSPMGMLIHSLRGIHICVPRNMVQAAGMYNTLLQGNEPGLVIECLNGYRLKEKCPDNLDTFTVPFGMPEVLQEGMDITLVTYGSCVRIAMEAISMLEIHGISVELIDVQTLLPFDLEYIIGHSLRKTNTILFLDEDVPGGATAYMMQHVMQDQGGYFYLDQQPRCLTAKDHRPAYGSDGDYFSKPNAAEVASMVLDMLNQ
jgi:pyruvate/2-oxoglutarate/acetoin dehydrogenase E1 component